MIRDRGKIKWTSMMLPEHVKLLRDWAKEDMYEKRREIDEQYIETLNEVLIEAIEFEKTIAITYYQNQKYEQVVGKIHHWDEINKNLHMMDTEQQRRKISITLVTDIQLVDG